MNAELLCEVHDGVAIFTLHRPERLNAMTPAMRDALCAAMARADADPAVRVGVLTGAGRGFCAGADVGRLQGFTGDGEGRPASGWCWRCNATCASPPRTPSS